MAMEPTPGPVDWEEVEEVVSNAYFEHELTPLDDVAPSLRLRTLPLRIP